MEQHLKWAVAIAREAGALTLPYFYDSHKLDVERKSDASPVTVADREAELLLRKRIEERFPEDAIFGEEFPAKDGTSGFCWFLDPIDGTKSFICGVPLYSTLIGIEKDGVSVAGVIGLPALDELIWAGKGLGAWHESARSPEPVRVRVSNRTSLADSVFLTSEVSTFEESGRADTYRQLERNVYLTRTWGDAYGYGLVATGRADLMVDPALSDWDAGPLLVVLEEAGGRFTDWKGNATIHGKEGFASNGLLHEEVLRILAASQAKSEGKI